MTPHKTPTRTTDVEQHTVPSILLAPPEKKNRPKSSTEMLHIMADFEASQGFPLLGERWLLLEDESSSSNTTAAAGGGSSRSFSPSAYSSRKSNTDSPVTSDREGVTCRLVVSQASSENDNLLLPSVK